MKFSEAILAGIGPSVRNPFNAAYVGLTGKDDLAQVSDPEDGCGSIMFELFPVLSEQVSALRIWETLSCLTDTSQIDMLDRLSDFREPADLCSLWNAVLYVGFIPGISLEILSQALGEHGF